MGTGLILHLHSCFVYAGSESPDGICTNSPAKPPLLDNPISTKIP